MFFQHGKYLGHSCQQANAQASRAYEMDPVIILCLDLILELYSLFEEYLFCRSVRMVGDTILTGSDDWTARVWSVSRGSCDAVLACHDGPVLSVEYSPSDKGIITG